MQRFGCKSLKLNEIFRFASTQFTKILVTRFLQLNDLILYTPSPWGRVKKLYFNFFFGIFLFLILMKNKETLAQYVFAFKSNKN